METSFLNAKWNNSHDSRQFYEANVCQKRVLFHFAELQFLPSFENDLSSRQRPNRITSGLMRGFVTSENENEIHKTLMLIIKFMLMFFMCFYCAVSWIFLSSFGLVHKVLGCAAYGSFNINDSTHGAPNENHKIKWGNSRQIEYFPFSPIVVCSSFAPSRPRPIFLFRSTHFDRKWTVKSNEQHNVYLVLFVSDCCEIESSWNILSAPWQLNK